MAPFGQPGLGRRRVRQLVREYVDPPIPSDAPYPASNETAYRASPTTKAHPELQQGITIRPEQISSSSGHSASAPGATPAEIGLRRLEQSP